MFLRLAIYVFLLTALPVATFAQVVNSSYVAASGEKVLQHSLVVPLDLKAAWRLFTIDSELEKWVAPKVHMELKTGGYRIANYDRSKPLSDSTSIKLGIINYLEYELLTFKIKLNNNFDPKVQAGDSNLQAIIRFKELSPDKTEIVASMVGWGSGVEWDKTYAFFEKGNEWTFKQILKLFP